MDKGNFGGPDIQFTQVPDKLVRYEMVHEDNTWGGVVVMFALANTLTLAAMWYLIWFQPIRCTIF